MPNAAVFVQEMVVACVDYDPARVRHQLDLAVGAIGVGGCLDEVLFPALRWIGVLWQSGDLDLESERLTSEVVRGWLEMLSLRAPDPVDAAPLILACGPADRHSIGIEALGVLLRHQGRLCRVLGDRTSIRALTTAVRANQPSAVVIASHLRANRLSATLAVRAAAALGPDVFYAGSAFGSVRLRRHVPGTHLNTNLQGACALILGPPPPTT
jgi:methanogenic corrinoid protein MtbC1